MAEVTTNDDNPQGTQWYQEVIYGGKETEVYPEEDHQIAALPKSILHKELGRRLGCYNLEIIWRGKKIIFSAVSDTQLLDHISRKLKNE